MTPRCLNLYLPLRMVTDDQEVNTGQMLFYVSVTRWHRSCFLMIRISRLSSYKNGAQGSLNPSN